MAGLIRFLSQDGLLWRAEYPSNLDQLCISEIWSDPVDSWRDVHERRIRIEREKEWLPNISPKDEDGRHVVSRIIWVPCELVPPSEGSAAATILSQLIHSVDLEAAYAVSRTMFAGVTIVPRKDAAISNVRSYALSFHPKLAMIWSFDSKTGVTQGVCMAEPSQMPSLQDLFRTYSSMEGYGKVPVVICASLLSLQIDLTQSKLKNSVREVEQRTGYHQWAGRHEQPASGDLSTLSARMSGCETRAASITRKIEVVRVLTEFALKTSCLSINQRCPPGLKESTVLDDGEKKSFEATVALLQDRLRMQNIDTQFFYRRIQVQIHAVSTPPQQLISFPRSKLTHGNSSLH